MTPVSCIALAAALGLSATTYPLVRSLRASGHATAAVIDRDRIVADTAEIALLHARRPSISAGKRPHPNVFARLTAALVEAGLPAAILRDAAPGEDAPLALDTDRRYRRQNMRVTLDPVTLPQLGLFLDTWRRRQPEWTTTTIQLTPIIDKSAKSAGALRPLRAALVMEATYLDLPQGPSAP